MMKNLILSAVTVVLAVSAAGCSRPEQVVSSDPLCLPQIDVNRSMEAARAVLEKMRFSIEKYDPDVYYIRTHPLSGAQFFQVWRQDNASAYTAAQANLQSLRRIVEIEATPYSTRTCLECRVSVQRLSLPEVPIEGVRGFAGGYTDSSMREQTLRLDRDRLEQMEWLDMGPDRALEQAILTKIKEHVSL